MLLANHCTAGKWEHFMLCYIKVKHWIQFVVMTGFFSASSEFSNVQQKIVSIASCSFPFYSYTLIPIFIPSLLLWCNLFSSHKCWMHFLIWHLCSPVDGVSQFSKRVIKAITRERLEEARTAGPRLCVDLSMSDCMSHKVRDSVLSLNKCYITGIILYMQMLISVINSDFLSSIWIWEDIWMDLCLTVK